MKEAEGWTWEGAICFSQMLLNSRARLWSLQGCEKGWCGPQPALWTFVQFKCPREDLVKMKGVQALVPGRSLVFLQCHHLLLSSASDELNPGLNFK